MYRQIVQKKLEWPKMAIQNFPDMFSQKDWYKFGMAKNGHSEFFQTIFPKKTDINLEWPKIAINFFLTIFPKKTGINLEWPKMDVPNFSQQFFPKKTGINSECPKVDIPNFSQHFFSKRPV